MRMPSGYGSVVKLSGKRRRPWAVRTSRMVDYVLVYAKSEHDIAILESSKFAFDKKHGYYYAEVSKRTLSVANKLSSKGVEVTMTQKQSYAFLAYFEKRENAYQYLAKMNSGELIKEHRNISIVPTFAKVYEEWLEHTKGLKKQLAYGTIVSYNVGFNNLKALHNVKVNALRPVDIQAILNQNNEKTQSGVAIIRKVLQKIEDYSLMQRYIDDGYMKYLVFEHTDRNVQIHKSFTEAEIKLLWDNLDKPFVDAVLTTIYTGLRPSELLTIRTKNVHINDHYMIGGMKTDAGRNRTIPLCDRIFPLIERFYDPDNDYLYPNHITYKVYSHRFKELMAELKLDHLPHDGRHTFATLMESNGANQICTKLIMGHSLKGNITEEVYTHKELSDLLEAVNLIQI